MRDDDDAIKRDLAKVPETQSFGPAQLADGGLRSFASFDIRTKSGAGMMLSAKFGECLQVESMVNKTILVSDYYGHEIEEVADDGEVKRWIRIVVFDNDGTLYQCGSEGVYDSLVTMSQIRGRGSFNPPIKCIVNTKRTAKKNNFMWLMPDVDDMLAGLPG